MTENILFGFLQKTKSTNIIIRRFQFSTVQLMLRDSEWLCFMKPKNTDVISFKAKKSVRNAAMSFCFLFFFCHSDVLERPH